MNMRSDYKDAAEAGAWMHGFRQGEAVAREEAANAIAVARESGVILGLVCGALFVAVVVGIFIGVTQ